MSKALVSAANTPMPILAMSRGHNHSAKPSQIKWKTSMLISQRLSPKAATCLLSACAKLLRAASGALYKVDGFALAKPLKTERFKLGATLRR